MSDLVLTPEQEARQKAQKAQEGQWCHRLKHQGGAAVLAELQALDLSGAGAAVVEAHRRRTHSLGTNQHRTDYPSDLARGRQIGSGMIEAACKTVVGQRLKESGMRWRERGTNALCHLRALHKSQPELWDHYWHHACL